MPDKNKSRPHIKQAEFAEANFSAIEAHRQHRKTLQSPYSRLPNVQFSSWRDVYLPNILWAAVVAGSLPRAKYLEAFRKVVGAIRLTAQPETSFVAHNWLAALSREEFLTVMAPLKDYPAAYSALSALRLVDSLPDREHWRAFVPEEVAEDAWSALARGVAAGFVYQSETGTDLCWLKMMTHCVNCILTFPPEQIEQMRVYPTYGDMSVVMPTIRAMEVGCRQIELGTEQPAHAHSFDTEAFWDEMRAKTECMPEIRHDFTRDTNRSELLDELTRTAIALSNHADTVSLGTGVDARRDAAFGLALYAISIAMEAASSRSHVMAGGRSLLRTIVEAAITLRYLRTKDDPTVWLQYRRYGMGQAKLAFLKNVREDELPSFLSLKDMHDVANDDTWLEFLDMDLGSWEKLSLRGMAEAAGLKDIYDAYYSWSSGFTHAQWNAVRDTAFATCLNPLHRFHRVFFPPRQMPSVLPDCRKLIDMMLDDVDKLYPSFDRRIVWEELVNATGAESDDENVGKE